VVKQLRQYAETRLLEQLDAGHLGMKKPEVVLCVRVGKSIELVDWLDASCLRELDHCSRDVSSGTTQGSLVKKATYLMRRNEVETARRSSKVSTVS
jgi:hypothetical protein